MEKTIYTTKTDCCGCEACSNVCPKGIIVMKRDEEGFYYPHIENPETCIQCDACKTVCPVKNVGELNSAFTKAYAGWACRESDVIESSSGGFATILARNFILRGGIVYGVAYTQDYSSAEYVRVTDVDSVDQLRTSKYLQARKQKVFLSVKNDLKTSHVLFIGTPCDVYALKRFIHDKTNLFTVSIICHGPTSEFVHQLFLHENIEKDGESIVSFSLRHKKDGLWKPYYIYAESSDGSIYLKPFNETDYNTAFLYYKRPSCGECKFKNNHFDSDLLIGDYHAAQSGSPYWNEHGVSSVLQLTEKGNELLKMTEGCFEYSEVPVEISIRQQAVHSPVRKNNDRKEFTSALRQRGLSYACRTESVVREQRKAADEKKKRKLKNKVAQILKPVIKIIKK